MKMTFPGEGWEEGEGRGRKTQGTVPDSSE